MSFSLVFYNCSLVQLPSDFCEIALLPQGLCAIYAFRLELPPPNIRIAHTQLILFPIAL